MMTETRILDKFENYFTTLESKDRCIDITPNN